MAPMKLRRRENTTSLSGRAQREEQQRQEERSRSAAPRSRSRRKNGSNKKNQSTSSTNATSANVSSASPLPSSSSNTVAPTSRPVLAAEDTSPDSKCPICLDRFNNLAYLDRCLHRFCFMCIQEWSHNKAECPLCKQPFTSILHSVRGENDFKKYTLCPRPELDSVEATIAMVAAMAGDERMRLTLRRDRGDGEDPRRHRHRRNRRNVPLLEWIVHAPPGTLLNQPLIPPEEARAYDLTERGIVFEGLTGLGAAGNMPPFVGDNRETRRLLAKLAARQRLQREGGTVRPLRDREMIALRRGLYRCGIRVRGVARGSHDQPQRGVSAESFCQNPSNLHRLRPWLRRELTVLYGAHDPLISIVVRLILNALARLGLEDLTPAADELRPFLLARTEQFLHELASFARSPLTMESYDLHAIYEPPDVAFSFERIDSSDSSAVIAISEDEERERGAVQRGPPVTDNQPTSLSGWDDETPGPSYTTVDPSCYLSCFSPAPQDLTNQNQDRGQQPCPRTPASLRQRDEEEDVEEECLIVGYKKPIAERTPELVQLSSDSDEEKEKKKKAGEERGGEKTDAEKGEREGKEETETNDKQPEAILPTVSPSTPCREEIVEDAQPSRSHSHCLSPVHSLTDSPLKDRGESRRRKREQRRNRRLRSGSFPNPNSSILPPLSSRHYPPSPRSSLGSDTDSAPGYALSVSPLNSSCPSTPLSTTSSSCFGSSPSSRALVVTPPPLTDTASVTAAEKPGGKRKYKSRHLDCDLRDPTWRPGGSGGGRHGDGRSRSKAKEVERVRREEREKRRRRRRRERQRRASGESRCREERSPSVEIIFEGTVSPAPKRKRRRQRHSLLSSSPLVITLDSESGRDLDRSSSACSSPFGSQQTVDFCHFPALPLVHSAGVGGTLGGGDIGELPVDILDRDSDKSERLDYGNRRNQSADLISLENSSDSHTDIDVERVETINAANSSVEGFRKDPQKLQHLDNKASSSNSRMDFQGTGDFSDLTNPDVADRQLLNSILSVLDGISAKSDSPSTSNPSFPQDNHFKNCSLSNILVDKPKNSVVESCQSPFYPSTLPPFLQLTENRKKCQNESSSVENTHIDPTGPENASEARTLHNLDTHREIADSLLALQDPESSLTSSSSSVRTHSTPFPSSEHNSRSTPDSDSLLSNLNAKTADLLSDLAPSGDTSLSPNGPRTGDIVECGESLKHAELVHEKVCGDNTLRLDIRNCAQTNTEDVK